MLLIRRILSLGLAGLLVAAIVPALASAATPATARLLGTDPVHAGVTITHPDGTTVRGGPGLFRLRVTASGSAPAEYRGFCADLKHPIASGTDYTSFERVVDAARRAGVRVIFVLENQYPDCSVGPARDDAWYGGGYAAPYGGYPLSFPDYARGLASHFRDEPTILAWEIMHEGATGSFDAMNGFVGAMSSAIRASDPNHLIALGLDNGNSAATDRTGSPSSYERLHAHPAVDLVDAHDFFAPDAPLPNGFSEIAGIAASLGKPAFVGASAVELEDTSAASFERRAGQVEAKLVAALDAGFAGYLVYDYIPDWDVRRWSFDTRAGEPLAGPNGVLVRHAIASP